MSETEQVLKQAGYEVVREFGPPYRGSRHENRERIIAKKGGCRWAVHVGTRGLLSQIVAVQSTIPMAAQIDALLDLSPDQSIALVEFIDGKLLWEMEEGRPSFQSVEQGLKEFVAHLDQAKLVHGDIRPWNMMIAEGTHELRFIDWGFAFFRGQVMSGRTPQHLKECGHAGWPVATIDRIDAERTLCVLLNPESMEVRWNYRKGTFSWRPRPWTR